VLKKILGLTMTAAMLSFASPVLADTSIYHDPNYDFSISYPDSWDVQGNPNPSIRWQVSAPKIADKVTCNIKANKDRRLMIYPERLMDKAVANQLNEEFWGQEFTKFNDVKTAKFYPTSGFGKGHASYANISYTTGSGKEAEHMTAIMLGSIYGDIRYVLTCSATTESFDKWSPLFSSIMGSITLKEKYHPVPTGYYRDFLSDAH
jgi:hypothetical protein